MLRFTNRVPAGFTLMIWQLDKCGGLQAVIDRCHALGIDGVLIKAADGNNTWAQADKATVAALHAAGIGVIGWGYVYGGAVSWSSVAGEAAAAIWALDQGLDGWLIDCEDEYVGKAAAATQYGQLIRAKYPDASIGYNPYPDPSSQVMQPWVQWNGFCDYCMPQVYQRQDWDVTPTQALATITADFAKWSATWKAAGVPVPPLVIDWQGASWGAHPTPASDITEAAAISVGKYPLITYFDWDSLDAAQWTAVGQAAAIFHGNPTGGTGMRTCANIQVQSEFQGFTGDCTQDAFDTAAHCAYPSKYPVTGTELNALVHATQAAGEAGPSGAMDPAQLAWLLSHEAIPYHQLVTPNWSDYTQFTAWQAEVETWGGIKPMVVQLAHGEWLPGSFSSPTGPAVGHAVALVGFDPATKNVLLGDGNSTYGSKGQTSLTPWATLVRALPYALSVLDVAVPAQGGTALAITIDHDSTGAVVGAHDTTTPTLKVGAGIARAIATHPALVQSSDITVPETALGEGETVAVVRGAGGMGAWTYSSAAGVKEYLNDGDIVKAVNDLYNSWQAAESQVTTLQAELAAAQAAAGNPALEQAAKDILASPGAVALLALAALVK